MSLWDWFKVTNTAGKTWLVWTNTKSCEVPSTTAWCDWDCYCAEQNIAHAERYQG